MEQPKEEVLDVTKTCRCKTQKLCCWHHQQFEEDAIPGEEYPPRPVINTCRECLHSFCEKCTTKGRVWGYSDCTVSPARSEDVFYCYICVFRILMAHKKNKPVQTTPEVSVAVVSDEKYWEQRQFIDEMIGVDDLLPPILEK